MILAKIYPKGTVIFEKDGHYMGVASGITRIDWIKGSRAWNLRFVSGLSIWVDLIQRGD